MPDFRESEQPRTLSRLTLSSSLLNQSSPGRRGAMTNEHRDYFYPCRLYHFEKNLKSERKSRTSKDTPGARQGIEVDIFAPHLVDLSR